MSFRQQEINNRKSRKYEELEGIAIEDTALAIGITDV